MPFLGTINHRLQRLAEENPQDKCYTFIGVKNESLQLSRQQLFDLSRSYASRLKRNGVKPVLSDGQDLFSTLRHSKCSTVITSAGNPTFKIFEKYFTSSSDLVAGGNVETIIPVQCSQAPWLKQLIVYKLNSHEDHTAFLSRLADEEFYVAPVTADDEAYIFLTSGSTGFSKMVPRTHRECLDIAENYSSIFTKDDVLYSDRPFGWIGGFPHYFLSQGIPTLVQELYDGVTLRRVVDVWDVALRLGATFTFTLVADIMQLKELYKDGIFKKSIGIIFTGAQPIKKNVMEAVGLVCERMMTSYGSTDVGLMVYGLIDKLNKDTFKDCYAGNTICPGLQLRLVDAKTKEIFTEPKRIGMIHFKGKTVLRRYLNVEDTTTMTFMLDGWLDTKDTGYLDEDGGVHIIGRQADMITIGAYLLYPQWMEERIQMCPGIQSVMVVGLPHPVTIQEICVCVIKEKDATLTLADLKNFCQGIFLEGATKFDGVPEKFVFMESFPLLSTGKVSRKATERMAAEYFKAYST
ncbi:2-succinylbenzoate--CoA ligase-like [Physella acuta]|uniref:2-succinylbenzoate--CoA ligase-like n=1 Tax=Physella acuta TaxID=109671 RepID=UPI0027DE2F82|nr:2-succinylbenzoate--CoA ligase-like [Physella acuta]